MSALRRLATAGLVFIVFTSLIAAQYSATYHDLTVHHAICPRDGEVIDVENVPAPVGWSSDQGAQFSAAADGPLEGHHQHCVFLSARSTRVVIRSVAPAVSGRSASTQVRRAREREVGHLSVAIYRDAPKHSPPVRLAA